ncbi:AraC family transcriptional regulator [Noviherbaspirillum autotrophicum]|uniref:AraC family transcriptional regulator n=1 Tax=Noviherbaspirillum autotrophicum TaxID=709839 RepID=A0A0C2BSB3_9BURK|nr:helix-turn-helix transcriptional regulator [Noviherbaspirillum autotrophicum]KIF82924.1 AraC family transcriptional regulator [Noviherbaspirillum autotrophicum]
MRQTHDWITIDVPDMAALPKAIFPRTQNLSAGQMFPPHSHRWNQFVYATSGTLVVKVAGSWYVITPEQAIWVPTGVVHSTGALNDAAFRNLYVDDMPASGMPAACTVFSVTPLLRALIVELENASRDVEDEAYVDKLNALILEQLRRLPALDFHLPWPQTPMLHRMCEALYANPADARSVDDWGQALGASARTLARRFEKEVGLSLREWRYRLRLFLAVEWLCAGRSVTEIALALGYASTSAFTYMFHQEMGCPPSEWRKK